MPRLCSCTALPAPSSWPTLNPARMSLPRAAAAASSSWVAASWLLSSSWSIASSVHTIACRGPPPPHIHAHKHVQLCQPNTMSQRAAATAPAARHHLKGASNCSTGPAPAGCSQGQLPRLGGGRAHPPVEAACASGLALSQRGRQRPLPGTTHESVGRLCGGREGADAALVGHQTKRELPAPRATAEATAGPAQVRMDAATPCLLHCHSPPCLAASRPSSANSSAAPNRIRSCEPRRAHTWGTSWAHIAGKTQDGSMAASKCLCNKPGRRGAHACSSLLPRGCPSPCAPAGTVFVPPSTLLPCHPCPDQPPGLNKQQAG